MSPTARGSKPSSLGFPRVSGDELLYLLNIGAEPEFSRHERG